MRVSESWWLNKLQFEPSSTVINFHPNFEHVQIDANAGQSMRMHQSWWLNESENLELS